MKWELNDEELPRPDYEIDPTSLRSVKGRIGSNHVRNSDTGRLHPIDRSENRFKPRGHLAPHEVELHRRMLAVFGENIIPFSEIEARFIDIGRFRLRNWMRRLWIEGYLDKYAKGIYMLAEQKYWRGKKNDWRGKYFGVHYQIIKKEYI